VKPWPIILIAGLLTGCVHYHAQSLDPDKTATRLEARRLDDAGLKLFAGTNAVDVQRNWPPPRWGLNALTLAAYYFHPDLAVAQAQWRVAEAGIITAGGRPNPTLSVSPTFNSTTLIPSPWSPTVNLDWPLETAGKRGKRIAAAAKVAEAARWAYVAVAWQIRSGVRAALLECSTEQNRIVLLQKQFETQNEIAGRLGQRLNVGAIARPEFVTAQMASNKTQFELSGAQAALAAARSHLAEAIGLPLAALDEISLDSDFLTPTSGDFKSGVARRAALLGRSDMHAALADYAAAEADLQLEIAKQYPDVHLNPGYQFDQGDNKWTLGLTLELPVLNQNQGPIAEAKARRELAAAKCLQLQAQIIAALDRAAAGLDVALAQSKTTAGLFALGQRQQQSVAAQVSAGAAEPLDLLNSEMDLNAVRLAQLDGETQLQAALGALEDALQRPADEFDALKFLPTKSQP